MISNIDKLQPWEALLKRILITQLGRIEGKRILDFGSGTGFTANYYAQKNEVVAIEPSDEILKERFCDREYVQLVGGLDQLQKLETETFDIIFCHNVLEYADNREAIVREFYRLLKPDGKLSVVKHNRTGRVMQMVVLLNEFDTAQELLDGKDSMASRYGVIRYYKDTDLIKWKPQFSISKTYGIRAFWDLQQNQEIHKDSEWQDKMADMELRVSELKEYVSIAFFHHIILTKNATGGDKNVQ